MGFEYNLNVIFGQNLDNTISGSFYVKERDLANGSRGIIMVVFRVRGDLERFIDLRGKVAIRFDILDLVGFFSRR